MNFTELMNIQSDLNNFTLSEKEVFLVDRNEKWGLDLVRASMNLHLREGEFIRHHSALIQMIDMYQWAGNREYLELKECLQSEQNTKNARVEIVDIMHFDLSILALTCTEEKEIVDCLNQPNFCCDCNALKIVRSQIDNLQLRKWWTSNKVNLATIRQWAISQFCSLLTFATKQQLGFLTNSNTIEYGTLFDTVEEVKETYLKKVEVNYERIRKNYDHIKNAEMGNESIH